MTPRPQKLPDRLGATEASVLACLLRGGIYGLDRIAEELGRDRQAVYYVLQNLRDRGLATWDGSKKGTIRATVVAVPLLTSDT